MKTIAKIESELKQIKNAQENYLIQIERESGVLSSAQRDFFSIDSNFNFKKCCAKFMLALKSVYHTAPSPAKVAQKKGILNGISR